MDFGNIFEDIQDRKNFEKAIVLRHNDVICELLDCEKTNCDISHEILDNLKVIIDKEELMKQKNLRAALTQDV